MPRERDGRNTAGIFMPDALMPSQYAAQRTSSTTTPERALRLAVIQQAVEDLERANTDSEDAKDRAREAYHWVCGEPVRTQHADEARLTFEQACEAVGFDAAAMRAGILAHLRRLQITLPITPRPEPRQPTNVGGGPKLVDRVGAWVRHRRQQWTLEQLAFAMEAASDTVSTYVYDLIDGGKVRRVQRGVFETVRGEAVA